MTYIVLAANARIANDWRVEKQISSRNFRYIGSARSFDGLVFCEGDEIIEVDEAWRHRDYDNIKRVIERTLKKTPRIEVPWRHEELA